VAHSSSARSNGRIKEFKNDWAHRRGQVQEAIKAKSAGSSNGQHTGHVKNKKISGKAGGNCVSLADKCPIHPDGKHMWGDCYQNILNKDKKLPAKGSSSMKGKSASTHEVNLMDIDPAAEEAINNIDLSRDECIVLECNLSDISDECKECEHLLGDECKDCMLDLSNIFPILDSLSNTFATLLAAKAKIADNQKGTSFDSIQALVSLDESITHHLDEILLTADQQDTNRKVLSNELLNVCLHTTLMHYTPPETVM
jgi:hypothetical protein